MVAKACRKKPPADNRKEAETLTQKRDNHHITPPAEPGQIGSHHQGGTPCALLLSPSTSMVYRQQRI